LLEFLFLTSTLYLDNERKTSSQRDNGQLMLVTFSRSLENTIFKRDIISKLWNDHHWIYSMDQLLKFVGHVLH